MPPISTTRISATRFYRLTYLTEHPLRIDGVLVQVSVSMGLAAHPEHGKTLSEVTERADQALYVSKREGRSRDHIWAA